MQVKLRMTAGKTAAGLFITGFLIFFQQWGFSQDKAYAKSLIDTLASERMAGRGYVRDGCRVASGFIAAEMKRNGLQGFSGEFFQDFTIPVNTFPGKVKLQINGKTLQPGADFIISGSSPSARGTYLIRELKSGWFNSSEKLLKLKKRDFSGILVMIDKSSIPKEHLARADSLIRTNFIQSAGFIILSGSERLLFSVSTAFRQQAYPVFEVLKPLMPRKPHKAEVLIEAEFHPYYPVKNVIGYLPGSEMPDSFLMITAHYDHLGMMGDKAFFPGANDNASGVAMMLDLARHFSLPANKLPFGLVFCAFAAEETGLDGSEFYVKQPLFPTGQISFLINLDMVGTGSEGITVVNGKTYARQFQKLAEINAGNEYLLKVAQRGESCNSDHCPFHKAGVPSVFIYSMGKEHREYHNIYDTADRVPMSEYEDIFRLLKDFISGYFTDQEKM